MELISDPRQWWVGLEPQWKKAFSEVFFRHSEIPQAAELQALVGSPTLRFAGPSAPFPNMSFELTNLSGIVELCNLEILVCCNHRIQSIGEVRHLQRLWALFVMDNEITTLAGVEELARLRQLYAQGNRIDSLEPVRRLLNLEELYIAYNQVSSLEGLTEAHSDKLENFYCAPNAQLKQREMLRVERELGIRCRRM